MGTIGMIALVTAVFWNLENFFDYRDDGTSVSETEFSAGGVRHWTASRFYAKCNAVGKVLLCLGDDFPDFAGFAEVENAFVVRRIAGSDVLHKLSLGTVHFESPDPRGIDCALLYRKDRARLIAARPCHIYDSTGGVMRTRDILLAEFVLADGSTLAIMVNHHPSKVGAGGAAGRSAAMARMNFLCDSLESRGTARILSMGDFNDDVWSGCPGGGSDDGPDGSSASASRTAAPASSAFRTAGTIKYNGVWEKIDGAFTRGIPELRERVACHPQLLVADRAFGGVKPLRTYSGPRYLGGVSDHLPVVFTF